MKKISITLNYAQLCTFCEYLTDAFNTYNTSTYEQKTVLTVLLDWQIKKLLSLTFLQYQGTKKIALSATQACAFVAIYQATPYHIDNYALPKILELVDSIDSSLLPF